MTTTSTTEQKVEISKLSTHVQQGGSGPDLVLLHHSTGHSGWTPFYERLAQSFSVTVPDLPGYGESARPDWAREPRDISVLMNQLINKLGLESPTVVGLGFGGFIAAELAATNGANLGNLVLVGAAGVRPQEGQIVDQMLIDHTDYMKQGFLDEATFNEQYMETSDDGEEDVDPVARDLWEFSRIMTARLTWSPYMFSRVLPELLGEVPTPTLLVWGSDDNIVPRECGSLYDSLLPNSNLEIVANAGHHVDSEQPEALAALIEQHVGTGG